MNIYKKNKKLLEDNQIYDSTMEHDACGVGMVASTDGKKYRKIVEFGIVVFVNTYYGIKVILYSGSHDEGITCFRTATFNITNLASSRCP